jgi:hypothetical protein
MGDAILLAVGAAIFALGYLSGRVGRARRQPKSSPYKCGCGHHLSHHDPEANACNASIHRDGSYVDCACKQYVGERPLDLDVLADQARAAQLRQADPTTPEQK